MNIKISSWGNMKKLICNSLTKKCIEGQIRSQAKVCKNKIEYNLKYPSACILTKKEHHLLTLTTFDVASVTALLPHLVSAGPLDSILYLCMKGRFTLLWRVAMLSKEKYLILTTFGHSKNILMVFLAKPRRDGEKKLGWLNYKKYSKKSWTNK